MLLEKQMDIRCVLVQAPPLSSFGNPQSKVIEALYLETQHGAESSAVRVVDQKTGKEYFVKESEWEAASRPPCTKVYNTVKILGRIPLDSIEAKVLGIGEKSGGLHTPLYDLLTKDELRDLTGIAASEGEGLVGLREAVLNHERTRSRPRILLLCRALSSKLNSLIFDRIYLITTDMHGVFVPFQGPFPKTVLEFLKLLNFETKRGPYTTKRLLGNSDWRETDLLWQYCELGLCPLPTRVFDTAEECDQFLYSIHREDLYDFAVISSNAGEGSAFQNIWREMTGKGLNPRNSEELENYITDNPDSDAVRDFRKMKRVYLVKQSLGRIREPRRKDYATDEGWERAHANWPFIPDRLTALANSITEELIYVAQNPAICDEALGLTRIPEASISQAQREQEEAEALEMAMEEARSGGGAGGGGARREGGGAGRGGGSRSERGSESGGGAGGGGASGGGGARKRPREE